MSNRDRNGGPSYPFPVWNGIFDHRTKIGTAIWVYLWCLDRITREDSGTGLVFGGSVVPAEKIALELRDSDRTIRRHLRSLAKSGYIGLRRTPYGYVITVSNSAKFNIWRADKAGHPDRTKTPARADKIAGQADRIVRCTKEDTVVDSAQRQNLPPTPLKEGGISNIWQQVGQYLKDDLATAYTNTPHFQEEAYDKYFRDAWLVEIRNGIAFLDSADPAVLSQGIEKYQRRLRETFRGVVAEITSVRPVAIEARY